MISQDKLEALVNISLLRLSMHTNQILLALEKYNVEYMLIGGVNFLLQHEHYITFDIDIWIRPSEENFNKCEKFLIEIEACWGATENDWKSVSLQPSGWLSSQTIFCMTSKYGAIDIFTAVKGLPCWSECFTRVKQGKTASGAGFYGISDSDMLECQLALPENEQKLDRIRLLRKSLAQRKNTQ